MKCNFGNLCPSLSTWAPLHPAFTWSVAARLVAKPPNAERVCCGLSVALSLAWIAVS